MPEFFNYRSYVDAIFPPNKEHTFERRAFFAAMRLRHHPELTPLQGFNLSFQVYQEFLWRNDEKPYYNVHTNLVEQLVRCKLEDIPSSYLEVPGGFDSVLIRFCQAHPLLTYRDGTFVEAIMISEAGAGPVTYSQIAGLDSQETLTQQAELDQRVAIRIFYAHAPEQDDIDSFTTFIGREEGLSLEGAFSRTVQRFTEFNRNDLVPQRIESIRNCLRLVATLGFIANTPDSELLEFDVLAKDRDKFRTSDDAVRTALITKAKRRGKNGWNVGTNEHFLPDDHQPSTSVQSGWQGGEHSHAHIRRGHIHLVRYGKGREKIKAKWFRPTIVRPDLPFLDSSRQD